MALSGNYIVRETTANFTRNVTLTVASILTVFVSLAIVGAVVLVVNANWSITALLPLVIVAVICDTRQ